MTKTQLKELLDRFIDAAPAIIVAARQHTFNRSCMICGVSQGEQHPQDCALWELVAGRIDFHRLSESKPRANGPDRVATMAALEAGAGFTQTAPELEFAKTASASEEWRLP